ncbi:MAG: HAMP domain-containing protein, partial [Pseudomonas sp.]
MLRLFLGLYLTLALGFAVSITTVEHAFTWWFGWAGEEYYRDAVRGPAYSLVEQVRPLSTEARVQRLHELQPHYGLALSLVEKAQLDLQPHEKALLAGDKLVVREELTRFIAPIDNGSQVLQIDLPNEPNIALLYSAGAYAMLSCLLGIVLFFWVRPHWRDLERLREAAQRFGENDFSARLYLSRRSNIRELAEHFNQMAARIEGL